MPTGPTRRPARGRPRGRSTNRSSARRTGTVRATGPKAGTTPPRRPPRRSTHPPGRRVIGLLGVLILGFAGILARLVLLQVKDASAYQALAIQQRQRAVTLPAIRGTIYDRNGEQLAMSLPAKAVIADPTAVRNPVSESARISGILGVDQAKVYAALTGPGRFAYVARGVDVARARVLEEAHLSGIGFIDESRRTYPEGPLAPQVLGFVGIDGEGLAGLELEYQALLAGHPGKEVVEEDPSGVLIPQGDNAAEPPVPGDDLVLTVDRSIQYRAQQELAAAVRANRAKGGTVIVMDPHTGEILAMASYPWFDPNRFATAAPDVERNRAVTDVYEPGSVNKVVTAAAALEEGLVKVNQKLTVPYTYRLYTKVFKDVHVHPTEKMTLGDILAYSSNVGTIEVAHLLGERRFSGYLDRFGLRSSTGSGFPGESAGILPRPGQAGWSGVSMGTIPIGQGIAVTPLQMTAVYATIANGGVWVQPSFVRATVGPDGATQPAPAPTTRRVVSEETADAIARMLGYAVDAGTGTEAQIPGYWVAGKTGTARKVRPDHRGYETGKYVASFIGFAPAARPAIVVTAILDEPVTEFGGIAAAPLFKSVAQFALARLRVAQAPQLPLPPHAIGQG